MTNQRKWAAVILAAGKSTRMKSNRSKVLHEVGGRSMLGWVSAAAKAAGANEIIAVVNSETSDVAVAAKAQGMKVAIQNPQQGTGDAVLAAQDLLADFDGDVVSLSGDTPFITQDTLGKIFKALDSEADVVVLGFEPQGEHAYGRLIVENGELMKIVEAKEASEAELAVNLCNSGVVAASRVNMFGALSKVTNNNTKGEYYLTDIVEILRADGKKAIAVICDETEVLGIDSRTGLARAENIFQSRTRSNMMKSGVTLRDPETVYFSYDTEIEQDAEIGANVVFGQNVKIARGAIIYPFCHLDGADIGEGALIGPFARLRPGTVMGEKSKAGNFVEVKKSNIGKGSKINHLSYIGDAEVAGSVNIGAGTITCNYDGFGKSKTIIGEGAFIGTHSSLVAPVTIGAGAYLASGGVITNDVPEDALALGRARQTIKEGWAKRFREAKAKRKNN
jgi:bifunctional UDP-N-acetylglucosamine pyrophosphorylase/glucosamine-1-phosphate N-acetyltransferase